MEKEYLKLFKRYAFFVGLGMTGVGITIGNYLWFDVAVWYPLGAAFIIPGGVGTYMMFISGTIAKNIYEKFDEQKSILEKMSVSLDRIAASQEKIAATLDRIEEKLAPLKHLDEKLDRIDEKLDHIDEKLTGVDGAVKKLASESSQN